MADLQKNVFYVCTYNCFRALTIMFYFLFLSNLNKVSQQVLSGEVSRSLIPTFNFTNPSSVTLKEYNTWFSQYGSSFPANLTQCDLEKEMQKVLLVLLL